MPHTILKKKKNFLTLALTLVCCSACTTRTTTTRPDASTTQVCETDPAAASQKTSATDATAAKELRHDELIERTLSFTSKQHTFQATLTLPVTAKKRAQLPGILLLQDWGKPSMQGTTRGSLGVRLPVEVHIYETLANELARRGFAVLRYNKRSCVQDAAPLCTYTRHALEPHLDNLASALLTDAEQALEALRQQPEVSPARIAVVGHGQGAEIAAALTRSASHTPAAIVLLSPSMQPVHRVVAHQIDYSLNASRAQLTKQSDDPLADLLRRQISMLQSEQEAAQKLDLAIRGEDASVNAAFGLPIATWKSFAALHDQAITALKREDLPATLTVIGSIDADLPESNAQALTELLRDQRSARQEILGDTTHDMIYIDDATNDPSSGEDEGEDGDSPPLTPSLHPNLATLIAEFLHTTLTSAP